MRVVRVFSVVAMLATCSCSSTKQDPADAGHSSPYPACDAIIEACHPVDVGDGFIGECHAFAHEATGDAQCAPKKVACVAMCAAAADAGADSGSADAGHD